MDREEVPLLPTKDEVSPRQPARLCFAARRGIVSAMDVDSASDGAGSFAYADFEGSIGRTFFDSEPSWPPEGAVARDTPNVVIVLVDDMGFSDVGCYGGEIDTPNIDRLASRGLRLTNFHVTPMCAPTRASLMTGVNHHLAGVWPMSCSTIPASRGTWVSCEKTLSRCPRSSARPAIARSWLESGISPR